MGESDYDKLNEWGEMCEKKRKRKSYKESAGVYILENTPLPGGIFAEIIGGKNKKKGKRKKGKYKGKGINTKEKRGN
jgi:hypothetical protein